MHPNTHTLTNSHVSDTVTGKEMAPLMKYLPCKHKDLSLNPQNTHKSRHLAHIYNPSGMKRLENFQILKADGLARAIAKKKKTKERLCLK